MFMSRFIQNTEEIREEDDGVEVTSQTVATEEVGMEEQIVSGALGTNMILGENEMRLSREMFKISL